LNIIVTGANGYVFSSVLNRLLLLVSYVKEPSKIIAIDNSFENIAPLYNSGIDFLQLDLTKEDINSVYLNAADVIFIGHGFVGAPKCEGNKEYAKAVNQTSVETLVGQLDNKFTKICFPSTNSIYGCSKQRECDEDTEIAPLSVYAETKYAGEKAVMSRDNTAALRLSTACGTSFKTRLDLLLHDFLIQLKTSDELVIYEPDFIRNFVHVNDIARAFEFAYGNDLRGVYNVVNEDTNMSKWEIAIKIKQLLNLDTNIVKGPGKDLDQRNYRISSKKLLDEGFEYRYSLEDAIREIDLFTKR